MFDNLEKRFFYALIIPLYLFMWKNDKLDTTLLIILLNFFEIDLINGTVNQIFFIVRNVLNGIIILFNYFFIE